MPHTRRNFLKGATFALGAARISAGPNDPPTPAELAAMAEVASAFMKAHSVPGLSVAIAAHDRLVYEQGFGWADKARGEKVKPSNLFRIASVTKPITSVTVYDLIEHGKLGLDDLVFGPGGILRGDFGSPPYKQYVGEIRLKHLLTHTAGGWTNDNADPMFQHPKMDHKQLITWTLANQALNHPPGEHYAYSNFGYCIVGRVIEKVTGQPYEKHVRNAILGRCGITDMCVSGNTLAERAPGEVMYSDQAGESPYSMNVRRMDSHGGWLATASDLVRFAIHVDGFPEQPDILRPASIKNMTTPILASSQYAKGWSVNNAHNWWHNGSLPGTSSIMVRTASGFCWAALANWREKAADTGAALDRTMWNIVGKVKGWNA